MSSPEYENGYNSQYGEERPTQEEGSSTADTPTHPPATRSTGQPECDDVDGGDHPRNPRMSRTTLSLAATIIPAWEEMSQLQLKDAIRTRDGMRCRECGMSNDEHLAKAGTYLEVHRLFPSAIYHPLTCITLCRWCHDKKPTRIAKVVYCQPEQQAKDGMALPLWINTYIREHVDLHHAILDECKRKGMDADDLIREILMRYFGHLPFDYCI